MLNKLRIFSKGKLAGVLVAIIIIPFVFWGMGSVFSGGNTNSVGKINNHNLSTKDFTDFINNSNVDTDIIKENINNNILEQLLTQLVSVSIIDLEIDDLKIYISDEVLAKVIKNQKSFLDENNKFSRTMYEKFLLQSNMTSVNFENGIRSNELKKNLFKYISGGIKSPYFLTNKNYKEKQKKVEIEFIDLSSTYIKKDKISLDSLNKYVEDNKEKFLIEKIDISYVKITPENMTGEKEFTENFFSKIDQIEDLILNNANINEISKKFNLKISKAYQYHPQENKNVLLDEVYIKRSEKKLEIVDKNDFFFLYEINNLNKLLPSLENENFKETVKNDFFQNNKFNTNKSLLTKIQDKKFTNEDFIKLSNGKIDNLNINSINDSNKFTSDSIKVLYSLGKNNFSLISDKKNNIYLVKIKNIYESNLNKNSQEFTKLTKETNIKIRDNIYKSYDNLLNDKYKININKNTLERIKNYFR